MKKKCLNNILNTIKMFIIGNKQLLQKLNRIRQKCVQHNFIYNSSILNGKNTQTQRNMAQTYRNIYIFFYGKKTSVSNSTPCNDKRFLGANLYQQLKLYLCIGVCTFFGLIAVGLINWVKVELDWYRLVLLFLLFYLLYILF